MPTDKQNGQETIELILVPASLEAAGMTVVVNKPYTPDRNVGTRVGGQDFHWSNQ